MEAATPVPTAPMTSGAPDRSGPGTRAPMWLAPALAWLGLLAILVASFGIAAGAAGGPTEFVPARAGGWPGWLAGPLSGLGLSISRRQLPDADADHVRRLRGPADHGQEPARARHRRGHRPCPRDPDPGPSPALPGRLRLPGIRPHGGAARPGPLHPDPRRSRHGPCLRLHRLAIPAFPVRAAVHARQLRGGAARRGGRAVGAEDRDGAGEPGGDRADRARRKADGPQRTLGGDLRRPEPRAARARGRRGTQRHAA